ncbi:hypothetical protein B7P43_G03315 [Cryptotermes secundus]|uniref:Uncharacterized protein n=1 Tax=Cryptotermes secundus TaxID=105785 RepID=A0A2J7PP41_9NEOP|nr:hypothetical protein B7P43_G03315 [Cryptotermes secundus]
MLMQVYWDNAVKKTAVYKCVSRFSDVRESVTYKERSGWPAMSITEENILKVNQILRENHRLTVRSIAEQVNIERKTVREEGVNKKKVSAKMVPKELTKFFLFQKIKDILKGRNFDDTDDIRSSTTAAVKAIPENQFQNCLEGRTRCWHQCMVTTVIFSNEVCSTFTAMSSRNLLSDHIVSICIVLLRSATIDRTEITIIHDELINS